MTTIVVFSGGLDSTTALTQALWEAPEGEPVVAMGFAYGQRHLKELGAARAIAAALEVPFREVAVPVGMASGSLLASSEGDVPLGPYEGEGMASTVVHGRNLLFASLAVAAAGAGGKVFLGVHGGDHDLYPDCRPEFWNALSGLVREAYRVELVTPYLNMTKAEIVGEADRLGAPLGMTWSCYLGGDLHCGECGTCRERRAAFEAAGVTDPTDYEV